MTKKKELNIRELSGEERMKYEIAEELGLLDKVLCQRKKPAESGDL